MIESLSMLTDEEAVEWLNTNIMMRLALNHHCGKCAYDEEASRHILIYSKGDVERLAKLTGSKLEKDHTDDEVGYLNTRLYFRYLDCDVQTFTREEITDAELGK